MKRNDILKLIKDLARSQGYYGRLYNELMYFAKNSPAAFDEYMVSLEAKNFKDPVDVILHFEG